jgi:hypothetical protein
MSKFLRNLLLQISKAFGKFKNLIFNSEILFPYFRPGRPCGPLGLWPSQPAGLAAPTGRNRPAGPPSPRVGCVFTGIRFPFWFTPSELAASPSSLCQAGPGYQLRPPPPVAQARPRSHRFPATECRLAPRLGCHRAVTTSPSFSLP